MVKQPSFAELAGSYCSPAIGIAIVVAVGVSIALISLFIVHSVTIWISTDPVTAFHKARTAAGYTSTGWNSFRTLYNSGKKLAFSWVPAHNTMAKHLVEPGVWIGLDIISQVFAGHHYRGIIKDSSEPGGVPFRGHTCGNAIRNDQGALAGYGSMTEDTVKFCSFDAATVWAGQLGVKESSDPVNAISNGTTLLLSTAHARKLQQIFTESSLEGESMFPAINLGPVLEAVQEITAVISLIQTTAYDIAAHVIFTIMSELAVVIWNLIQILVRTAASVIMALVSSGAVQTLIKAGIDLLLMLVVHVGLPLLLAALDLVLCGIDLAMPGTWPKQLACGMLLAFFRPLFNPRLSTVHRTLASQWSALASRRAATSDRSCLLLSAACRPSPKPSRIRWRPWSTRQRVASLERPLKMVQMYPTWRPTSARRPLRPHALNALFAR